METFIFKIGTGDNVSVNRNQLYTVTYKPIDKDAEATTPEIKVVGIVTGLSLDLRSLIIRNDDMSNTSVPMSNIISVKAGNTTTETGNASGD